jgi:hypothetical protein
MNIFSVIFCQRLLETFTNVLVLQRLPNHAGLHDMHRLSSSYFLVTCDHQGRATSLDIWQHSILKSLEEFGKHAEKCELTDFEIPLPFTRSALMNLTQ